MFTGVVAYVALKSGREGPVDYKELFEQALRKPPRAEPPNPPKPPAADPESGIPYCQWRANQLNRLFAEHGTLKQPARITAQTVEHGLEKQARRNP
jgi:hypothetical protein